MTLPEAPIEDLHVSAYRIPTDCPESDGTAESDATTVVLVQARGGGRVGLGWSCGDVASATVITSTLREVVLGGDALPLRHLEYFHDHARLEPMLFDGVLEPRDGALHPDLTRPGNGLELERADAERYAI